jgi:hypothetical protein
MVLDARHLDEGEAGFSSTRTSLFQVTKQAPNEARIGLSRPLIVSLSFAPSMRLCLYSLMHPCLFGDMPPVLSDAFADRQSTSGKARSGDERTAQVKRTHGHDMCRIPLEAKGKDPGETLLETFGRSLYGAPIWPGITSRYTYLLGENRKSAKQ